jgi:predicted phosphodiesterase
MTMLKKIKRHLIIGDVHGCYEELLELLAKANYNYKYDQLVFVGDLINKGPFSREVLEFAYNHHAKVVIGNHEMGLIRYVENNIKTGTHLNITKLSLGKDLSFWIEWMKKLPAFINFKEFSVVHAGQIPHKNFHENDRRILCTMRTWDQANKDFQNPDNPPWFHYYHDQHLVVFGHNAVQGLITKDNAIGLDTGCVYGRKLSLLSLPEREIIQVDAKRQYFPIDI